MSHPLQGYTVHTGELRDEARIWSEQGGNLGRIVHDRDGLRIDREEAGIFQLVITSYGPLLDHVVARCDEGRHRMEEIAGALQAVARGYDETEREGERLFGARF